MTISVGDQHRFSRRDQSASVLDHLVKRGPLENRSLALVNGEQVGKEVLLLTRGGTELARKALLHLEAGLIGTAAGLMRVEVGHRRESVEEGLAVVTSTPLEQFGQAGYGVERPRRQAVGFSSSPTSEQGTSVSRSYWNLVRDDESLLELSGHANKLVNRLFHVLDLGQEVLGVAHLEAELAAGVTHHDREGVRADNAGRRVDPVEVGRTVDAVEEAEAVLELAVTNLENVKVSAKLHRNETAATIIDRASRFDGGT